MFYYKQTVFWFLSAFILFGVTILCAEAGLWVLAQLSRQADIFTRRQPDCFIRDARGFISRGNPHCQDHDAHGYRNHRALSQAEIVTLGDSWTYGAGVSSDAAWPHVLSERLNRQVYNMALPETGPLQSRELLRQALELHPKVILFGFYFGNDLLDDFFFAQKNNRLPEFLTAQDIADITKAEGGQNLKEKVDVLFSFGRIMPADPPQSTEHPSYLAGIQSLMAENSRLYGFLRSLKNLHLRPLKLGVFSPRYEDAVAGISEIQRPYVTPFSEGG